LFHPPPLWREGRTALELATLLRHPVYRSPDPDAGQGRGVLLIPGFLAGDESLRMMGEWLRRQGYVTTRAGIRTNVKCSERAHVLLETRIEELAELSGNKVSIVGHSRGGMYARVLAMRRPDLVDTVVGLGAPLVRPLDVHPLVLAQVLAVGALGTIGRRDTFTLSCLRGDCCSQYWHDLHAPLPDSVRFTSIYSKSDGIVRWQSCLDPDADHVEIDASHCGMAVHAGVYGQLAELLLPPVPGRRRGGDERRLKLAA
jgi:pimeloyl-ACP methyl ester carboxylesterase